uniref:Zona pellucida protein AX 4 n=1 Tax=Labrus bergylta TaxID=56723 RepID=A0A3Q3GVS4_9LABR
MVDLVAACSMHDGSYDRGYIIWKSSEVLYPSTESTQLNIGLNGDLVESSVSEERAMLWRSTKHNADQNPHDAEGVHRKSFVSEELHEFYIFHLYLEQTLVDEDLVETRLRFFRTLSTPLLPRPVVTENQTLLEELTFTVYLGELPEDVALVAVHLNGEEFTVPFSNLTGHTITKVFHPNNTHGYTLKVPFDDPVVTRQFSREDAVLQYRLDINYTLSVLPENNTFYHLASIEATFTDISPPVSAAVCSESGISFKLDHRPYDYLWEITIGSDPLTSELAAQHGYIMSNNSQSLLLEVPLYAHGYEYKDLTLKGFFGTFEILVRDRKTSEVQSSTVKTCPFTTTEFILCSTDGRMTVVADVSLAIPSGGVPARTNAIDKYCGPKETDDTRALFSFPLNGCGTRVELGRDNVTYQNEIFYSPKKLNMNKAASANVTERVVIQCTYPLAGLHRLFTVYRFESDSEGVGSIIHTTQVASVLLSPTKRPTTALVTIPPTRRPPPSQVPAFHPPARYVMVSMFHNLENILRKDAVGQS